MSLRLPDRKIMKDSLAALAPRTRRSRALNNAGYTHELEPIFLLLETLFKGQYDKGTAMHFEERATWMRKHTPTLYAFLISRSRQELD